MSVVTRKQIELRIKYIEMRKAEFMQKKKENRGALPRGDWWRLAYLSNPYLIGASDEMLSERWSKVFFNISDVTSDGKIGMQPIWKESFWMERFTELMEEYGLRGGHPVTVIEAARQPILRYFKDGRPVAMAIFKNYVTPGSEILVKYGKKEHLERMYRQGEIRICPASYYDNSSHNAAIRDNETTRHHIVPTYRERLAGRSSILYRGANIEFGDDDIIVSNSVDDYYLYSLCDHIYYRLPTDFEADAAVIIKKPRHFIRSVVREFTKNRDDLLVKHGPVTYFDPYRDYDKRLIPQMCKEFSYSYQKEQRIVFMPRRKNMSQLSPEFISIGSMVDYADFVHI